MYDIVFLVHYYVMHGTIVFNATGGDSALSQVEVSKYILDSEHLQLDRVNPQNAFITCKHIAILITGTVCMLQL